MHVKKALQIWSVSSNRSRILLSAYSELKIRCFSGKVSKTLNGYSVQGGSNAIYQHFDNEIEHTWVSFHNIIASHIICCHIDHHNHKLNDLSFRQTNLIKIQMNPKQKFRRAKEMLISKDTQDKYIIQLKTRP